MRNLIIDHRIWSSHKKTLSYSRHLKATYLRERLTIRAIYCAILVAVPLVSGCSDSAVDNNSDPPLKSVSTKSAASSSAVSPLRTWNLVFDYPEYFGEKPSEWTALIGGGHIAEFSVSDHGKYKHSGALVADIKEFVSGDPWDIQAYEENITVNPGQLYYYSLWVKGPRGSKIAVNIESGDFSPIRRREIVLVGYWQKVSMDFVADLHAIRTPIHYGYFENNHVRIYIDDARLEPAS